MKTNKAGLNLIKTSEGCKLVAYQDSVGVWTIGYGQTGPTIKAGLKITQQQAEDLLAAALTKFEVGVAKLVKVPVNDNEFAALVCFAYNVGLGNLSSSTLLKKLNAGDHTGAADEFLKWNKAGGTVLAGLIARRGAERALFLTASPVTKSMLPAGPSDDEINKQLADIENKILTNR